jgi:hypothetical protein
MTNSSTAPTPPPASLFAAVLFQQASKAAASASTASEDKDNVDKMNAQYLEPLLQSNDTNNNNDIDMDDNTITKNDSSIATDTVIRLKMLSFGTGSITALLSQYLLSQTLWNETVLEQTLPQVVFFSFVWSFWTCIMVFATMFVTVRVAARRLNNNKTTTTSTTKLKWDETVFQMEAHHIVGALLAISLAWIFVDVLRLGAATPVHQTSIFLVLTVVTYGAFFRIMLRSSNSQDDDAANMMPTYQLLATTLGLIVGLCSQFVLSFLLWKHHMTVPIISHILIFSLTWSILTVAITFCGCLALRTLALDTTYSTPTVNTERIHLRMESYYVFSALIGICGAWVLMDLVLDMPQQIAPSLGMLAVALAAFRAILYCFPEEQCLEEFQALQQQQKGDEEEGELEAV